MKNLKENVMAWLMDEASDDELIQIVSEVNSYDGSLQDYAFYWMEDLNDLFCGVKPVELLEKLADGFRVSDEGFKCTIWGLESCSVSDITSDIREGAEEVADAIINNLDNIDAKELKNYLEEIDLEEE